MLTISLTKNKNGENKMAKLRRRPHLAQTFLCNEGADRGREDAEWLIKKHNPASTQEFIKIHHELKQRINYEYKSECNTWKKCYLTGVKGRLKERREWQEKHGKRRT
jgi:hypothetical protein